MATNLERLEEAYRAWHDTKGGSAQVWAALMADRFQFKSVDEDKPGLAFSRDSVSRDEAVARLSAIFDDWTMLHYSPSTYVDDGKRIAVFGTCGFRHRGTGKDAEVLIGCLWEFEGDKAISLTEIFDSAAAVAAATPDAASGKGA